MHRQRSVWLVWIGLLWLVIAAQTAAQPQDERTLLDIIRQRGDLTTFSAFVSASYEEVPALLNADGSYTVFAPNNTAFANLASLLEVPLGELLQKPEVISQLVRYHIFDGENDATRLIELDGSVVPTLLPNAFVAVRQRDDGVLTLNNVVSVVTADLVASNGVLHIVDDVLLNRVIVETLNNPAAEEAITPNPTPEPPTPAPTPTPLFVGQVASVGYVRFANLLPGDAPLTLQSGALQIEVASGTVSDFALLPAGTSTMTVAAQVFPLRITAQVFQTVALLADGDDNVRLQAVVEDYSAIAAGDTRLTLLNALPDDTDASVFADGSPLLVTFSAGSSAQLDYPAGVFAPTFNISEMTLRPDAPLSLPTNGYTFIALYGTAEQPQLLTETLEAATVNALRDDLQRSATDEPLPSIAQVLGSTPDFSFLAEAVEAMPESLQERVTGAAGEPLTLLAPSDAAFTDFLVTANLTRTDLLNDTALLRQILLYHMLDGEVSVADLRAAQGTSIVTLLSLDEAFFVTEAADGRLLLNNVVSFIQTDIPASNGVLHIIDEVLLPRRVVEALGL